MSTDKAAIIESRIDRAVAGGLGVSLDTGGANFVDMGQVMEFAKVMAVSGVAVPSHLRTQQGACLAVCIQAIEWRMSPFAVANKSYVVNDRLCFESQLIHAVIEQRAPLAKRLRCEYAGDGDNRTCTIIGYVRGEDEPLKYTSPPIGKIKPKNSPLWTSKPDLQLYYNASRDWARMYFPDVIMGVYSDDELERVERTTVDARPRTISELTAKLTQQPPVARTEETQPELSAWDRYEACLSAAADERQVEAVYDAAFGPDSGEQWTDQQRQDAVAAKEARKDGIARKKGGAT